MKRLLVGCAVGIMLLVHVPVSNAGIMCAAAKMFKYQSDVLNYYCMQEIVWESSW